MDCLMKEQLSTVSGVPDDAAVLELETDRRNQSQTPSASPKGDASTTSSRKPSFHYYTTWFFSCLTFIARLLHSQTPPLLLVRRQTATRPEVSKGRCRQPPPPMLLLLPRRTERRHLEECILSSYSHHHHYSSHTVHTTTHSLIHPRKTPLPISSPCICLFSFYSLLRTDFSYCCY